MFIKHTNYEIGSHDILLIEKSGKLRLKEPFFGDVKLECRMEKNKSEILLVCELTASSRLVCDRCNEEFERELKNKFSVLYLYDSTRVTDEDTDVIYISSSEDKLELTDIVKDYAYLSIPMKKLCRDDCKGLCPRCGTNLNISDCNCENEITNPVWEKLLELKKTIK